MNQYCNKKNVELFIISHKTLYPIIGEKINLHKISKEWIAKKKIFQNKNDNWIKKHIFFLKTKEKKIKKIIDLKCDYFIDDLIDILNRLPRKIKKIHFDPFEKNIKSNVKSWQELSIKFNDKN